MSRLPHATSSRKFGRPLAMGARGRLPVIDTIILVLSSLSCAPPQALLLLTATRGDLRRDCALPARPRRMFFARPLPRRCFGIDETTCSVRRWGSNRCLPAVSPPHALTRAFSTSWQCLDRDLLRPGHRFRRHIRLLFDTRSFAAGPWSGGQGAGSRDEARASMRVIRARRDRRATRYI